MDLRDISINRIMNVPMDYIKRNKIIPLYEDNNYIEVGAVGKSQTEVIQYLEFLYGKDVVIKSMPENIIKRLISIYFGHIEYMIEKIHKEEKQSNSLRLQDKDISIICDYIINKAIDMKASDIHIEPREEDFIIRCRVNGSLIVCSIIEMTNYLNIISRFKILSGMNIAEKRVPQDGKMVHFYNNSINIRVATMPTILGEKMVLRLLYNENLVIDLESLCFERIQLNLIEKMLKHNCGIILVNGPTGSGKSTTLYSILNKLNKSDINICTVEDPVEINIKGINQTSVNTKAGITFSAGLRSLLRQDPDIIMIGEIRDEETAEIAIRAAITGHLVLSTIHTNSAFGVVTRLLDMQVERYLIKDALVGCISQRLVKKLCPKCKAKKNKEEHYSAVGCPECNYTGYKGRALISETIYFPEFYLLEENIDFNELKEKHKSKYGKMLEENIDLLLKKGTIDTLEAKKNAAEF